MNPETFALVLFFLAIVVDIVLVIERRELEDFLLKSAQDDMFERSDLCKRMKELEAWQRRWRP